VVAKGPVYAPRSPDRTAGPTGPRRPLARAGPTRYESSVDLRRSGAQFE
jgi:hypothetical protein